MPEPLLRTLPVQKIHPRNTALLIIDMERDFVAEGAVQETPGGRALIPAINGLSAWARGHGLPVIFTIEAHRADQSDFGIELEYDPLHCLEGTSGCELPAGLDVQDYRVLLARDAVAAVSPEHQAAALLCMSDVFAYITSCAELRALWD